MDCGLCSLGSRYGFAPAFALLVLIAASSLPACSATRQHILDFSRRNCDPFGIIEDLEIRAVSDPDPGSFYFLR